MIVSYGLLLLNIALLVLGQLVWKTGLDKAGGLTLQNLLPTLTSPLILLGVALYGIATVVWLAVLSRLPLSTAYPLQSIAYVLGILIAWGVFQETVPLTRWIGAAIIVVGVVVVAYK